MKQGATQNATLVTPLEAITNHKQIVAHMKQNKFSDIYFFIL
jgi:hypothetical protein